MAQPITNKKSRWYKKQLLDKSDQVLRAKMAKEGHRFASPKAATIAAAMRYASSSLSVHSGVRQTERVVANRALLPSLGFREMGNGFLKLGHSTWQLSADTDGDVVVNRLQAETVDCAKYPKRNTAMQGDLEALGYPQTVIASLNLSEKMALRSARTVYKLPEGVLLVRGLPARVAAMEGGHFLVEFQGSGITCFQPVASVLDQDANSRFAALQESVEARVVAGAYSRQAKEDTLAELQADPDLSKDEMEEFIAGINEACKSALQARMSGRFAFMPGRGSTYTPEELVAAQGDGAMSAHTAQSVNTWTPFNGKQVCDFADTLHAVLDQDRGPQDTPWTWELYDAGKLMDTGAAATEQEAKDDCATATQGAIALQEVSNMPPPAAQMEQAPWVGLSVINSTMVPPETGTVTAEISDETGAPRFLDVEYPSGKQGRIDLNFWAQDAKGDITRVE